MNLPFGPGLVSLRWAGNVEEGGGIIWACSSRLIPGQVDGFNGEVPR